MPGRWNAVKGALVLLVAGATAPLEAGDITVFASRSAPEETWARGYGAALSSTWFKVVALEAEAARMPAESEQASMTAFTGSALLAPPLGPLTPYGGFGVGLFRQSVGDLRDTGVLKALVLGAKLRIGGLFVLKGEYRDYDLSGEPLLPLDWRASGGVGIAF